MTRVIFEDWLKKLNSKMKRNKRFILLFLDNCSAHSKLSTYSNIRIEFLPPNTTSKLQPLDQGIIRSFKRFYRTEIVRFLIDCLKNGKEPKIKLLMAMKYARKAWLSVSEETVKNCFRKSHFLKDEFQETEPAIPDPDEWQVFRKTVSFEEYVSVDDNVTISGILSNEEIVAATGVEVDGQEEEEDDDDDVIVINKPTREEALQAITLIQNYFQYGIVVSDRDQDMVYGIERTITNYVPNDAKQSNLDSFLNAK